MGENDNSQNREVLLNQIADEFFDFIEKKYDISRNELLNTLKSGKTPEKQILIPTGILSGELSSLEAIVKYLKENLGLSYKEIALLTNRITGSLGATYKNAKRKFSSPFSVDIIKKSDIFLPLSIIENRKLSVLESICKYLKDERGLRYHQIAKALQKDDRTVWTVCKRAENKLKINKNG